MSIDRLGVVGHELFDTGDAVCGEVGGGTPQEARAGRARLVGQDLAVGQPGMVVDDRMHVVKPATVPTVAVAPARDTVRTATPRWGGDFLSATPVPSPPPQNLLLQVTRGAGRRRVRP